MSMGGARVEREKLCNRARHFKKRTIRKNMNVKPRRGNISHPRSLQKEDRNQIGQQLKTGRRNHPSLRL